MSTGSAQKPRRGPFGWLRAVDDGVFAVEQAIVALALIGITIMVFVDVVARRISAPDSKMGVLMAKIAGITDPPTRQWIDVSVAPWVTLVGSLVLVGFGLWTARRMARERVQAPPPPMAREAAIAVVAAVVVVGAAWGFGLVFEQLTSSVVYGSFFGLSAAAYVGTALWRRTKGWPVRATVGALLGGLLVWFAFRYMPEGYTWSKKVSLMLLLWVGLLSASICVHEGKHLRLEALGKLVPTSARRWVHVVGYLMATVFCGLMTWLGLFYLFSPEASDDPELPTLIHWFGTRYVMGFGGAIQLGGVVEGTDIPDWVGTLSVPVGFGIAALRFLGAGVSSALGGSYGAPAAEEGMEEARQHALEKEREAAAAAARAEEAS
jgi:TRAP-type C4-dicarboxylate transport system permease small subunit